MNLLFWCHSYCLSLGLMTLNKTIWFYWDNLCTLGIPFWCHACPSSNYQFPYRILPLTHLSYPLAPPHSITYLYTASKSALLSFKNFISVFSFDIQCTLTQGISTSQIYWNMSFYCMFFALISLSSLVFGSISHGCFHHQIAGKTSFPLLSPQLMKYPVWNLSQEIIGLHYIFAHTIYLSLEADW